MVSNPAVMCMLLETQFGGSDAGFNPGELRTRDELFRERTEYEQRFIHEDRAIH